MEGGLAPFRVKDMEGKFIFMVSKIVSEKEGDNVSWEEIQRRFQEDVVDYLQVFKLPRNYKEFVMFAGRNLGVITSDIVWSLEMKNQELEYCISSDGKEVKVHIYVEGFEDSIFSDVARKDGDIYGIIKLIEALLKIRLINES